MYHDVWFSLFIGLLKRLWKRLKMIWKWQIYENIILMYYYCNNSNYNTLLLSFFVYGFIFYSIFNILTSHVHEIHSWKKCHHDPNIITITITLRWALEIWNFHSNQQAFQLFKEKKTPCMFHIVKELAVLSSWRMW